MYKIKSLFIDNKWHKSNSKEEINYKNLKKKKKIIKNP